MIRIYFDSNVYRHLKKDEEKYSSLFYKLEQAKNRLMFYYSYAHLSDLTRDKTDRKYEDLSFMEKLVDNNYLNLNTGEEIVIVESNYPTIAFKSLDHTPIKEAVNFDELFEDDEFDDDYTKSLKKIMKGYLDLPVSLLGFPTTNELSNGNDQINKLLPNINKESSIKDLMSGMLETTGNLYEDPSIWKELRSFSMNSMDLKGFDIDITKEDFNHKLKDTQLGKSFIEFVEDTFKHNKNLEKQREYNFFLAAYNCLNILGLDKEINKKSIFSSIQADAQHSFYAAHCDYLVSDDEQLLLKSKVLYNLFGIETNVLNFQEFTNKIDNLLSFEISNADNLIEAISQVIEQNNILHFNETDDKDKQFITYDVFPRHFDFFNRLDLTLDAKSKPIFGFYNSPNNYSRFTSYEEFKAITKKFVDVLGNDLNNNGQFTEEDKSEIDDNNWKGRIWIYPKTTIILQLSANNGLYYMFVPDINIPFKNN